MASPKAVAEWANNTIKLALALLNSDIVELLKKLWPHSQRTSTSKTLEGMYEVLEFDARLELKDEKGRGAVLYKRQKVRFLQDNIIAYQDKAWGDGKIFAEYKCSPGKPVDRYRDGHRWRVLISLRETKQRDDVEEFHIERTIRDGFTKSTEEFQAEIDHATKQLAISVVFPRKRFPKRVLLIEQNSTQTIELGPQFTHILPDGRRQVKWQTENPQLFEAYIIHWAW